MFLSADAHLTEADAMKQKSADAGTFIRQCGASTLHSAAGEWVAVLDCVAPPSALTQVRHGAANSD